MPSTHLIHVMADTPRAPSPRAPSPRAPSPRAPSPRAPTPRATAPIAPASSVPPPSASAPGVSLPPPSYNEALQPIYQPPGRQISTDSKEEVRVVEAKYLARGLKSTTSGSRILEGGTPKSGEFRSESSNILVKNFGDEIT